jgi:predicted ATPase
MENNNTTNTRGSEWRKWDLHFHTPTSHDYQDKSITNQQIIDKLAENNISAVAITDHQTINASTIQELQKLGKEKNITVFAGIEFCSELGGKESIHFIGIFPENSDISSIWTSLQGQLKITPADIMAKGGLDNIQCDLIDTCDIIHELGGITTIHAGTKTNTVENIKNNLIAKMQQKQRILSNCIDILELGKVDDIKSYQDIVFKSIGFTMPMILCSDNHNVYDYSLKQNCWIKANTTFEGLKQILFEPEERVRIQETKPEEKNVYQVIDSVILDNGTFWKDTIFFNENLNTIIGGRSTGKSTLLKSIAKKIDNSISTEDFITEHLSTITVKWKDGEETASRDIDFFPQSYMYEIAKDRKQTNKLIQNIITNTDENNSLSARKNENENIKRNITTWILELFQTNTNIFSLQNQLKECGDKKGVETEISRLGQKLTELNKNCDVQQTEIDEFNNSLQTIQSNNQSVSQYENDLQTLTALKNKSIVNENYLYELYQLSDTNKSELSNKFQELKDKVDIAWHKHIDNFISTTKQNIETLKRTTSEIQQSDIYKKGVKYYTDNKELSDVQKKLNEEKGKLQNIENLEKQITELSSKKNKLIDSVVSEHLKYKQGTQKVVDNLQIEYDELKISLNISFKDKEVKEFIESRLNQRGYERQGFINTFVENYDTDTETQLNLFLTKALNNEIEYKNYNNNQNVVNEFFTTNWYSLDYELTYQNDTFAIMSEGKQAFVILKLLLDFSPKKCPILIDQPEDSLDNRAIYNELVKYLKTKKKDRQIILVTHNPNVVVSADAENVIVANQNGNNAKNKNDIKFQYINGSLENTKPQNNTTSIVLESQGIREHVCEILEGGKEAFEKREKKYGFKK